MMIALSEHPPKYTIECDDNGQTEGEKRIDYSEVLIHSHSDHSFRHDERLMLFLITEIHVLSMLCRRFNR